MARLNRKFFLKDTLTVARNLLGVELVTRVRGVETAGIIVEVEAYGPGEDLACHSYVGKTQRNSVMFDHSGHCYVYFSYGMHHCVNVVTEPCGIGAAVLIRALEPTTGILAMKRRRKTSAIRNLTSGPGKLCEALAIDKKVLGDHLATSKKIWLRSGKKILSREIGISTRIGISKSKELQWRFFVKDSPYVSKK